MSPGGREEPAPATPGSRTGEGGLAAQASSEVVEGLAEERTALAWTRTGLSFTVAGVVLLRLLRGGGPLEVGLAGALVVLGAVAWLWGRYAPEARPAGASGLGRAVMRLLSLGTALVAVTAVILLLA